MWHPDPPRPRPRCAPMTMDDTLHDRQAYPCPFIFVSAVQALEHTKEFVYIRHIEAHAVVFHKIDVLPALLATANLDRSHLTPAGKFEGIGQEVDKDLLEQGRIRLAGWQVAHSKANAPFSLHNA